MADLLVRDLSPEIIDKLEWRARHRNVSLEEEAKSILEEATPLLSVEEFVRRADEFMERMKKSGRKFSDSADLVRQDRDR